MIRPILCLLHLFFLSIHDFFLIISPFIRLFFNTFLFHLTHVFSTLDLSFHVL